MMPWIIEELKLKADEMKFIWLAPGTVRLLGQSSIHKWALVAVGGAALTKLGVCIFNWTLGYCDIAISHRLVGCVIISSFNSTCTHFLCTTM